jgi:hypothetical protein
LDPKIADLAEQFVLLRVEDMRSVNLEVFEFDWDLTWFAFFLNSDEQVLGRFGGRVPEDADKYKTIDGLRAALEAALRRHRDAPPAGKAAPPVLTVERYPAAKRVSPRSCVHCHNVWDWRRESLQNAGTWRREEVWVYPPPENAGWTLDPKRGNRLLKAIGPAAKAGIQTGDLLQSVNGLPVASFGDVQYALHKAPAAGELAVSWVRDEKSMKGTVKLAKDWKQTDLSWRRSLEGLEPGSGLHGKDLTAHEKEALGLTPKALAFRQGNFLTPQARQAGILQNDIILGIDGKTLELTARQFDAHIRLNYNKDDTVTVEVLRQGRRVEMKMKLKG